MQDQIFLDDNFFVISKDNCKTVQSKFYGFCLDQNELLIHCNPKEKHIDHQAFGTYVNILRENEKICIEQDFFGGYGLFVYQSDDYWAISNSFLYLVNYLKKIRILHLNSDYVRMFFCCDMVPLAFQETMVNELCQLPPDYKVYIDTEKKSIEFERFTKKEEKKSIQSAEAIQILDQWHYRWNALIRQLSEKYQLAVDLSGGFDSRASFSTCCHPNINFDQIQINSSTDNKHTHTEDLFIAQQIASIFNFTLNAKSKIESKSLRLSTNCSLNISLFSKATFHKQLYYKNYYKPIPVFAVTGSGGESLRSYWYDEFENFVSRQKKRGLIGRNDFSEAIENILNNSIMSINDLYPNDHLPTTQKFYNYIRQRNHFCKSQVESFLTNVVTLAPLMDPVLDQIEQITTENTDRNLLFALIYERYLPEISHLTFQGKRTIRTETLQQAKKINAQYPLQKEQKTHNNIVEIVSYDRKQPQRSNTSSTPKLYCANLLQNEYFQLVIKHELGEEALEFAKRDLKNINYFPEQRLNSLVAIYLVSQCCQTSQEQSSNDLLVLLDKYHQNTQHTYFNNLIIPKLINNLQSARIDIIHYSANSNIILQEHSANLNDHAPMWFMQQNGAQGHVFITDALNCTFKILIKGSPGVTHFIFRGIDYRENNIDGIKRIPLYVNYTKILITETESNKILYKLPSLQVAWHDDGLNVKLDSKLNQKLTIHLEYLPHAYSFAELQKIIENHYAMYW